MPAVPQSGPLPNTTVHRISCQEKNTDEGNAFNRLVQGVLTFSIREANGDMPDEPPEGAASGIQVIFCCMYIHTHEYSLLQ